MLNASIVLYNSDLELIFKAIDDFKKSAYAGTIYLIDNSQNASKELQELQDDSVVYFHNDKNVGFGTAHNIAFRQSVDNCKYHVIINPDITFDAGSLDKIVKFLDENVEVGLLMPEIVDEDGKPQRMCKLVPAPFVFFARRFLGKWFRNTAMNHKFEMCFMDKNRVTEVPFLSGCFMIFRSVALKEIGFFDEKIFLFCEDVDINRRMWRKYKTVYFPEVCVTHHHEYKSFKNFTIFKHYLKAVVYYFNKWGWLFDSERREINKQAFERAKGTK